MHSDEHPSRKGSAAVTRTREKAAAEKFGEQQWEPAWSKEQSGWATGGHGCGAPPEGGVTVDADHGSYGCAMQGAGSAAPRELSFWFIRKLVHDLFPSKLSQCTLKKKVRLRQCTVFQKYFSVKTNK
jgi:hypothetical protein